MFMRRIVCAVFYFLLELVHQPMILTAVNGPARQLRANTKSLFFTASGQHTLIRPMEQSRAES